MYYIADKDHLRKFPRFSYIFPEYRYNNIIAHFSEKSTFREIFFDCGAMADNFNSKSIINTS